MPTPSRELLDKVGAPAPGPTSANDFGVQCHYEGGPDNVKDAILKAAAGINCALSGYTPQGDRFLWFRCRDQFSALKLWQRFKDTKQIFAVCEIKTRAEHQNAVRDCIRMTTGNPDACATDHCRYCGQDYDMDHMTRPGCCTGCYVARPTVTVTDKMKGLVSGSAVRGLIQ